MGSSKSDYVLVEETDSFTTAEFQALQRQTSSKNTNRNGKGQWWVRIRRNLMLVLLGLFLFADAVVIGMLVNHYLMSR